MSKYFSLSCFLIRIDQLLKKDYFKLAQKDLTFKPSFDQSKDFTVNKKTPRLNSAKNLKSPKKKTISQPVHHGVSRYYFYVKNLTSWKFS